MAGLDVARRVAGNLGDLLREVVPRAYSLVREVVDARFGVELRRALGGVVFENGLDGPGQVIRIGRGSGLVEYDLQRRLRGGEVKHRLHEVATELAVEPGRAEDDVFASDGFDMLLAFEFGPTVDACGSSLLILAAGRVVGVSSEDIVGRDVDEQSADRLHGLGENLRSFGIELAAQGFVAFGLVYVGICRTVDNASNVVCPNGGFDGCGVRHVEKHGSHPFGLDDVGEEKPVAVLLTDDAHLAAQLAVGARNQYVHGYKLFFGINKAAHECRTGCRSPSAGDVSCPYRSKSPCLSESASRCPMRCRGC